MKPAATEALADLIVRCSTASISYADIAKEAKCTSSILFYYWDRKSDMFRDAIKWLQDNDPVGLEIVRTRENLCERSLVKEML